MLNILQIILCAEESTTTIAPQSKAKNNKYAEEVQGDMPSLDMSFSMDDTSITISGSKGFKIYPNFRASGKVGPNHIFKYTKCDINTLQSMLVDFYTSDKPLLKRIALGTYRCCEDNKLIQDMFKLKFGDKVEDNENNEEQEKKKTRRLTYKNVEDCMTVYNTNNIQEHDTLKKGALECILSKQRDKIVVKLPSKLSKKIKLDLYIVRMDNHDVCAVQLKFLLNENTKIDQHYLCGFHYNGYNYTFGPFVRDGDLLQFDQGSVSQIQLSKDGNKIITNTKKIKAIDSKSKYKEETKAKVDKKPKIDSEESEEDTETPKETPKKQKKESKTKVAIPSTEEKEQTIWTKIMDMDKSGKLARISKVFKISPEILISFVGGLTLIIIVIFILLAKLCCCGDEDDDDYY